MQQEQSLASGGPALRSALPLPRRQSPAGRLLAGRFPVRGARKGMLLLAAPLLGSALPAAVAPPPGLSAPIAQAARPLPGRLAVPPPTPEPLTFEHLSADDARLVNLRIPFTPGVGAIAPAFFMRGSPDSRARAVDCLASAMWYEAGESDLGQRAVAQVVLNRVRHPAFPKSVCGVVFQGSERTTGCQFTFTCDGAMRRRPSTGSLALARLRAEAMLQGAVVPQVGLATHYHTDWVHPAWSSEMDKLARIDTHLFFRWHGNWGQAPAFRQPYGAEEPAIAQLSSLSEAHRAGGQPLALDYDVAGIAEQPLAAARPLGGGLAGPPGAAPSVPAGPLTMVMLPGGNGGRQSFQAMNKCTGRQLCKVFGYVEGDMANLAFVYVRDRRSGWVEVMLWNCKVYPRDKADECLSATTRKWVDYPV